MTHPPAAVTPAAAPAQVLAQGEPGGPCAVFVHGAEDRWQSWSKLAGFLPSRWRAVALDLPWRAGNDYRWRWAATASDWLAAGLDAAVGDGDCVLVGHSFGANVVLHRLSVGEPRAAAAVLAAPFFRPEEPPITWKTVRRARAMFERQIADGVRTRLRGTPPQEVVQLMIESTCRRIGPTGFLAVFDQYVASGNLPLSHVGIRTRILVGQRDPSLYLPHINVLAGRLVNATVSCAPDWGHFSHLHHARQMADAIQELDPHRRESELHASV